MIQMIFSQDPQALKVRYLGKNKNHASVKNIRLRDSQPFVIDRRKSEHLAVGRFWEVDAYENRTTEGLLREEVRRLI